MECTAQILGEHFVFPQPNLGCLTLLAYPVLFTPDWQSIDGTGQASWKERVVHTHTSVRVTVQPNPLWLGSASRLYIQEIQAAVPTALVLAPWRSALFIYDDDEVLAPNGLTSMFSDGWQETERYIPGTFREGRIYHQSSVVEWTPEQVRVETSARRRLETGQGLYWCFEMGCVNFSGDDGAQQINEDEAFTNWAGPFWLLGQFSSSYIE